MRRKVFDGNLLERRMKQTTGLFISVSITCLSLFFIGGCVWERDGEKPVKIENPGLVSTIPLLSGSPVIDGIFDYKEWGKASCVSGFVTTGNEWAQEQTAVYMITDGKDLFLAMRCLKKPPLLEMKAKKHPADSKEVFGDESVEMFIMPDPNKDVYYHFAINAVGSVYTAKCDGGKREDSWDPRMEAVSGTFDSGWVLEVKIDLSSIGAKACLGDKWKMNFARNSSSLLGRVSSSWTGQDNFNVPSLFGSCFIAKSGGLGYSLERIGMSIADLVARNADPVKRDCELIIRSEQSTALKKITLEPFSNTPVTMNTSGVAGDLKISIGFGDSQSTNVKTSFLSYEYGKMFSIAPSLYYCRTGEVISSKINSLLENVSSIKVTVTGPGQEKPLRKIGLEPEAKSFSFDTVEMQPGRHVISAVAEDVNGKVLDLDEKVFFISEVNEPEPLPEKQKIELDRRLIKMNGKLFFPFMSSPPPKENSSPLADNSFNVRYGDVGVRKNAISMGQCGFPSSLSRDNGTHYEVPDRDKVFRSLRTVIENNAGTTFLCRRLQYEARIPLFRKLEGTKTLEPLAPKEEYTDSYKFIKKMFPETLVSIQNDQSQNLADFVGCADIIEVATPSSYAKELLQNFKTDLDNARATVGDKPLLLWVGASIPSAEERSAENLRAATYLAIFGGANGIIYHMGHEGIPGHMTRLWSVFKNLGREVEFLYPIAATGEMVDIGLVSCDSHFILLSVRKFQGDIYVAAVNKGSGRIKARIKIGITGDLSLADNVEVLFEGRSVKIENGKIADMFTGMEPHVYRIKARK